jgi:hypothetical protein
MLDKLTTYTVCWYKMLYQVLLLHELTASQLVTIVVCNGYLLLVLIVILSLIYQRQILMYQNECLDMLMSCVFHNFAC